jgi:hypothetical protein
MILRKDHAAVAAAVREVAAVQCSTTSDGSIPSTASPLRASDC